jgi:hypothetical protein
VNIWWEKEGGSFLKSCVLGLTYSFVELHTAFTKTSTFFFPPNVHNGEF